MTGEVNNIKEGIRTAFNNHADETAMYDDGYRVWGWGFSNRYYTYYTINKNRNKKVPEEVLGIDYYQKPHILNVDGWQAYNGYNIQRCLEHLFREIKERVKKDKGLVSFRERFGLIYHLAKTFKDATPDVAFLTKENLEEKLTRLTRDMYQIKKYRSLAKKLFNPIFDMFKAMEYNGVSLDNNFQEQNLKKLIKHRKNSGCIRNNKGKLFIENVLSVVGTYKLQRAHRFLDKSIFEELQKFAN